MKPDEANKIDNISRVGTTGAGLIAGALIGSMAGAIHGATSEDDKWRKALRHGLYGAGIGGAVGTVGGLASSYPVADAFKSFMSEENREEKERKQRW